MDIHFGNQVCQLELPRINAGFYANIIYTSEHRAVSGTVISSPIRLEIVSMSVSGTDVLEVATIF